MVRLPRRELLEGSRRVAELEPLLAVAERVLRTWEPQWSGFLAPGLREEAEERLGSLSELTVGSEGGWPGAERRRLLLRRAEADPGGAGMPEGEAAGLLGLEIAGNFLFDPAEPDDFRAALEAAGAAAAEVGDVWGRGDRGAQAIVVADLARRLEGAQGQVRTVPVTFRARPLAELQMPAVRLPRAFTTVEASLRLDAVASAGFGLSRSRMAELVRRGAVRIDWQPATTPSRELAEGERVQLEGRGELVVGAIERTRRDRYRIRLERR